MERFLMGNVTANLLYNFERASDALLCNVHVASEIAAERARVMAEPVKSLAIDLAGGAVDTQKVSPSSLSFGRLVGKGWIHQRWSGSCRTSIGL